MTHTYVDALHEKIEALKAELEQTHAAAVQMRKHIADCHDLIRDFKCGYYPPTEKVDEILWWRVK